MADIRGVSFNFITTQRFLSVTDEGLIIAAPEVAVPRQSVFAMIFAWSQLVTASGATHVTPRIRRGANVTGALVGEANAEELKRGALDREPWYIMVGEQLVDVASVQYSFTLQLTGPTNGAISAQQAILVLLM